MRVNAEQSSHNEETWEKDWIRERQRNFWQKKSRLILWTRNRESKIIFQLMRKKTFDTCRKVRVTKEISEQLAVVKLNHLIPYTIFTYYSLYILNSLRIIYSLRFQRIRVTLSNLKYMQTFQSHFPGNIYLFIFTVHGFLSIYPLWPFGLLQFPIYFWEIFPVFTPM